MSKYGYKMINPPARCHGWRYEKTIHIHPPIQRVGFSQQGTRNTGAYVSINDDYTIHSVVSKILSEILINERVLTGFILFLERSSNWYDKKIGLISFWWSEREQQNREKNLANSKTTWPNLMSFHIKFHFCNLEEGVCFPQNAMIVVFCGEIDIEFGLKTSHWRICSSSTLGKNLILNSSTSSATKCFLCKACDRSLRMFKVFFPFPRNSFGCFCFPTSRNLSVAASLLGSICCIDFAWKLGGWTEVAVFLRGVLVCCWSGTAGLGIWFKDPQWSQWS